MGSVSEYVTEKIKAVNNQKNSNSKKTLKLLSEPYSYKTLFL